MKISEVFEVLCSKTSLRNGLLVIFGEFQLNDFFHQIRVELYETLPGKILSDLIFVTDITDYIRGKKICHVEKFQISVKNLNNFWSFIEFMPFLL